MKRTNINLTSATYLLLSSLKINNTLILKYYAISPFWYIQFSCEVTLAYLYSNILYYPEV
jgi:hypothetical protein